MKIEIAKRDLLEALDRVRHTASGSKMVQILQCFCFRDGRVSTYNGASGTTTKLDMQGMDFAVEASRFYKLMNALYDTISLDLQDGRLHVKSGGGKYDLGVHPTKGFPEIIQDNFEPLCEATNFTSSLERVAFTVSQNAMKPALMGVGVSGDSVYSSDGMRICVAKLNTPANGECLIPSSSVEHLIRLGQPTSTFMNQNVVGAYYEPTKTVYICGQVAAKFPVNAAREHLKNSTGSCVIDFPEDLSTAIDRVRMVVGEEENEIVVEHARGELILQAKSEAGLGMEVMPITCEHPFKFAVRPEWLKKAFECTRKVDITDVVSGQKRILRFTDEGFDHVLSLMSLRD